MDGSEEELVRVPRILILIGVVVIGIICLIIVAAIIAIVQSTKRARQKELSGDIGKTDPSFSESIPETTAMGMTTDLTNNVIAGNSGGSTEKLVGGASFEEMMENIDFTKVTPIVRKVENLNPDMEGRVATSYEIKLQALGYEDHVYSFVLENGREYTIGRTTQSDYILDGQDKRLSGVHCKLCFENNTLYLWDMDSTNGTFVNGIPIQTLGKVAIHSGETVRVGSYEYRIG